MDLPDKLRVEAVFHQETPFSGSLGEKGRGCRGSGFT
jgi:hypothetical protein